MKNEQKLLSIIKKRIPSVGTESKRIFHGRGEFLEDLMIFKDINIDYYSPVIHITLFRHHEFSKEFYLNLNSLFTTANCIVLQKRYLKNQINEVVLGALPKKTFALEAGLKYKINFTHNQNIGFFLDMKLGRELISKISKGKSVLNLFSYTCSISVAAQKGGASSVVNMDMSSKALSVGRENHRINNHSLQSIQFFAHNIFKSFSKIKRYGPYDLIVIDPPTDQGESFKLDRDYPKLLKKIYDWQNERTELVLCCNSPYKKSSYIVNLVREHLPEYHLEHILYGPDEFNKVEREKGVKILYFKRIL